MRILISVAALIFLLMAIGPWEHRYSHLVIPLFEMAIVGGGLFAIFIALVLLSKSDRNSE